MRARLPRIPMRHSVEKLEPYVPPVEGRAGKLRLDFNENTVGCSSAVLRALRRLTREQIGIYPEYEATIARVARFFRVRPEEMLLTNGVDDALHVMMDTFLEPGSTVLLVEPTFNMYRFYAQLAGARFRSLHYTKEMEFPLASVLKELQRRPRAFLLANPNNPTATLVTLAEIRAILLAAPRTLVLVDEAYFEFCGVTVLPWIRRYPNLIVSRTFSKAPALAGLRLGCLFACREIIAALKRADSPYPVNVAALVAAEAVIRDRRSVRAYVEMVLKSRRLLAKGLERLNVRVFPSAANFLLADFGQGAKQLVRKLERRGILLRDRSAEFGREGFVRVTVGTPGQTRRLLRAIEVLR